MDKSSVRESREPPRVAIAPVESELSLASRAAWLSYVGGFRQEDIAARLGKGDALRGYRKMWFPNEGYVEGAVYDRYDLTPGLEFEGPGVVEERESTMVIGPKGKGLVTAGGNVEVSIHG